MKKVIKLWETAGEILQAARDDKSGRGTDRTGKRSGLKKFKEISKIYL